MRSISGYLLTYAGAVLGIVAGIFVGLMALAATSVFGHSISALGALTIAFDVAVLASAAAAMGVIALLLLVTHYKGCIATGIATGIALPALFHLHIALSLDGMKNNFWLMIGSAPVLGRTAGLALTALIGMAHRKERPKGPDH